MSLTRIKRTSIWKNTLGERTNDEFHTEREKLRNAFLSLRDNVNYLVTQIASALPELTQHDISHLDALWETSSLLVGENFEITPLEGFVLGSAFLIHDSALCFEAYENGKEGLRMSKQWKDAFEDIKESNAKWPLSDIEHHADFIAIRNLHAFQAEKLLNIEWKNGGTGRALYLLENQELRNHLGKIIGQIASSHHWNIETVSSTFNTQLNSLFGFPSEWRIDPLKLACILRCSDAAHLDNERAPDFLYALIKRSGISLDHWKAQNRLAKVDIDQSDFNKSTLIYTSTIDFDESDSNAWYILYDALSLVDKEIRACNSLLEKHTGKGFKVRKVKGIDSPESLSNFIKAKDWKPCSAQVHVGNVEKIIQNLGGEMLYGTRADNLEIVLRELVQNSRDSIKARAVFDEIFEGKIVISLDRDSNFTSIVIEDNGIGMSERILTGPLLDFGTSFWTSSLVQSEFPGLRSSKFNPIGKFGIGFYSVFMISNQVFIASRNFTSGTDDLHQLKFINGFSLRPILSKGGPLKFNPAISTQVKLKLKPNIIPENILIPIKTNRINTKSFNVPFKNYLMSICAGLDVNVYYKEFNSDEIKIHEDISSNSFKKLEWLTEISFANYQLDSDATISYISQNISRLKPITENGTILGLAAINTKGGNTQDFLSLETIGGLASTVHYRDSDEYIGYLDYNPKSAKREVDQFTASEKVILNWVKEQLNDLLTMSLSPFEKYIAASSLCHFKTDPSDLTVILTIQENKSEFLTFDQLAELSLITGIAFLNSGLIEGGYMETHHNILKLPGYALIRPLTSSKFLSLKMLHGIPENNFSILDCLYRAIIKKRYEPYFSEIHNLGENSFGQKISVIILSSTYRKSEFDN